MTREDDALNNLLNDEADRDEVRRKIRDVTPAEARRRPDWILPAGRDGAECAAKKCRSTGAITIAYYPDGRFRLCDKHYGALCDTIDG